MVPVVMDHNKNDLSPKEHRKFRHYMEKGIESEKAASLTYET